MNKWFYIAISTVFALFIFQDLFTMDALQAYKQTLENASSDELILYASQGFYYLTMLLGGVLVLRKYKHKILK